MYEELLDDLKAVLMEELMDEEYVEQIIEDEDYLLYHDMSLEDVAWEYIEDCMGFDRHQIQFLYNYLDIDSYVHDLRIEGQFIECDLGIIEILG